MLVEKFNRLRPFDAAGDQGDFLIRSFVAADRADVWHLYHKGVLAGHVDPRDCVSDLDDIEGSYFQRAQDHFWVAEARRRVIGTIALSEDDARVAHLLRLRVAPFWQLDDRVAIGLIRTAVHHARVYGCLKLVFQTTMESKRAFALLDGLGLQFSRIRDAAGRHLIEFYDNLYTNPVGGSGVELASVIPIRGQIS